MDLSVVPFYIHALNSIVWNIGMDDFFGAYLKCKYAITVIAEKAALCCDGEIF
ncbi:257_t:CDS:2 [Gigaspora margarita]|uniref:257_t:CDS:1 n=1 Tax=Gigaspora margarita TaxID=4874 RepID=A0ABN7UGI3_GIGMA|nr:257_t:CDS:2 [Gigaspora margarita]